MRTTTRSTSFLLAALMSLIVICGVVICGLGSNALASQKGPDAGVFINRLENVLSSGFSQKQILFDRFGNSGGDSTQVSNDQLSVFTLGAKRQANIWADTILGGDYEAAGNTEVDVVEAVLQNNEVVAYHITYSEKAWYTGNCDQEKDLNACSEGRIVESSYVSPAATTWVEDSSLRAKFINMTIR